MDQSEEIKRRVAIFLSEEAMEDDDLRLYLTDLKALIAAVASKVGRSSLFLVLGAAVFLLLSRGNLKEAELFGVKVQDFGFFRLTIPVVMAHLSAHIVVLMNSRAQLLRLYRELVRQSMPKWIESAIGTIPLGNSSFFLTHQPMRFTKRENALADVTFYAEATTVTLLPLVFGIYAYISIFSDDAIAPGWAVASLLLTFAYVILAFAHLTSGRGGPPTSVDARFNLVP